MGNIANGEVELFASAIVLILLIASIINIKKTRATYFMVMAMVSVALALITDAITWFLVGNTNTLILLKIFWILDYALILLCLLYLHLYFLEYVSWHVRRIKIAEFLFIVVIVISIILWTMSMFNEMFYYFDDMGYFYYAKYHLLSQLPAAALLTYDALVIIKNRKKIDDDVRIFFSLFIILPILSVFTELFMNSAILVYLAMTIAVVLNFVFVHLRQGELVAIQDREIEEKKTQIMLSQIQPHFLYNAITSIMVLCKTDSDMAVDALADFSDYLRGNLELIGKEKIIPFSVELEHIKTYIRLEKLRFFEKLNVEFDIRDSHFMIPTLTIQPLVENAVKHGITKKENGGTIKIITEQDEKNYYVRIIDDGVGFDSSVKKEDGRTHVGLENVKNRLVLCMGAELNIESKVGVGTKVTVVIPK